MTDDDCACIAAHTEACQDARVARVEAELDRYQKVIDFLKVMVTSEEARLDEETLADDRRTLDRVILMTREALKDTDSAERDRYRAALEAIRDAKPMSIVDIGMFYVIANEALGADQDD